jgi:FkbM family methyltransferase
MTTQEQDIRKYFNPREGDIVVDVGAAFGTYSLFSSRCVGMNGKIIAIDAHPEIYTMLNLNVKLNHFTNVICLNSAVYSRKMKLKIYSNYTIMPARVQDKKTMEKFVEVNADTLDNLLLENDVRDSEVNWIKIDAEGAELEVLLGATNILSNSKDLVLLIEIHGQNNYIPIIELLNSYNLKVVFERKYEWGDCHIIVERNS